MQYFLRALVLVVLALALFFNAPTVTAKSVRPLFLEEQTINDYCHEITFDKDGFLWLATDNGVKRYDGYQLKSFEQHPNVPASFLSNNAKLLLDDQGTLWAGGSDLVRYIPQNDEFSVFKVSDGADIWSLYQDQNDIIWLGGANFGLRGIDKTTGELKHQLFTDSDQRLINVIEPHTEQDKVWVVTGNKIYLLNINTLTYEQYPWPDGSINGLIQASDGMVWISTAHGLWRFNPVTLEFHQFPVNPDSPSAMQTQFQVSLLEDAKGNIWIGSDKQGVHQYNPKTNSFIHIPASRKKQSLFPPGAISSIYQDEGGTIWFTVGSYGVYRISEHLEKFSALVHNEETTNSLGFNNVSYLYQDEQSIIWIATDGGGLDSYDPLTETFQHFHYQPDNPNSLSSDSILSIAEDSNNNLWFGTYGGGISKYDKKTRQFTQIRPQAGQEIGSGLGGSNVFKVYAGEQDKLLLSLWNRGLQVFDPATNEYQTYFPGIYGAESGIKNNDITAITKASNSQYWIGGSYGVEIFDLQTEKFQSISIPNAGGINDLYQQGDNTLWIAAEQGLIEYQIDTKQAKLHKSDADLANNFIVSILPDQHGYLWLGTRNGLNRFNSKTLQFKTFDKHDGLAGNQFNRQSNLLANNGMIYLGGVSGISRFNPSHLPQNLIPPKVQLTRFEINHHEVNHHNSDFLNKPIHQQKVINLSYEQKDLAFEFTALNFITPEKNRFRFRLLGLESNWKEVDSDRRWISYTNLDPKKYRLEVKAANNDGVWSKETLVVDIHITPPWWQTWWAKVLFFLMGCVALYGFTQWRLVANRLRQQELRRQVALKTAELEKAHNSVRVLNTELEQRVFDRTQALFKKTEEQKATEAKLFHMAFHDPLTDLANRPWLLQQLERNINTAHHTGESYALMFIDGDRFKKTNDTHGHMIGDELLKAAAKRLQHCLPNGCDAIRLGGDEFTVLVNQQISDLESEKVAQAIIKEFNRPFLISQFKIYFRVSIGVVVGRKQYTKPEEVLRDADIAMYHAKQKGRGCYQIFDAPMRSKEIETSALESDLNVAIEQDQLFLVYQPIINLKTKKIEAFEALLRWQHPIQGLIPPDQFIPIAEDSGQIIEIGLWVLKQACLKLSEWSQLIGEQELPVIAVNLSPKQLNQADLIDKLDLILKETKVSGRHLKLEITETALMENYEEVNTILNCLREREIELAIDDFGTGYSSLSYLDKLPVQVLKIDRSFVDSLINRNESHEGAQEIIKATISLAHNLKVQVVAEGIETQEQLDFLIENQCDFGQGYLIDRPLNAETATRLITQ